MFRALFEATVRRRRAAGLVAAKDAAIDASLVAVDASWLGTMREGGLAPDPAGLPRPVREWLADEALVMPAETGRRRGPPGRSVARPDRRLRAQPARLAAALAARSTS